MHSPRLLLAFVIALLAVLPGMSQAWTDADRNREPQQEEQGESVPRGETLEQLLLRATNLSTFDVSTLYDPPSGQEYTESYRLLGHSPVTLILARNATVFDADERGLAVGFTDGRLATFGKLACPELDPRPDADETEQTLPDAVTHLAYGQDSPWLAATHEGYPGVSLFDLEDCELDRRLEIPDVTAMAMSRSGGWLALARADGQVVVGRPDGPLRPVDLALPSLLGLGFGPEGGVLYAVARTGETVVWDLVHGRELSRFRPRGGPFSEVTFHGRFMGLAEPSGRRTAWDLAAREQVPYTRQLAQFFIEKNTLRYRTWNPVLNTRKYHGAPEIAAWHARSLGMIRVDDLDGAERCYDTGTGSMRPCATAPDFERVELTQLGGFFLGEVGYRLADVASWWGHDVLLSRFVPGQGWFLWWVRQERPREYRPLPEYLPQRESIRADAPQLWAPVVPPAYYP